MGRLVDNPKFDQPPVGKRTRPYDPRSSVPPGERGAKRKDPTVVKQEPVTDPEMISLAENRGVLERRVADTLDTLLDDEALKTLIGEALLSTEDVWISCPHCNKRSKAPQPKPMDRVKAFITLRQHAVGMPPQRHDVTVTVRQGVAVSEMTDEELEALAQGQ